MGRDRRILPFTLPCGHIHKEPNKFTRSDSMPQCEKCRGEINSSTGFCRSFGAPYNLHLSQATNGTQTKTYQPSYPPPPPSQPTSQPPLQRSYGEEVLGVLLLRKPK